MRMFNMEKLDETIEYIEDSIMDSGALAETIAALASLVQARTVAESHVHYNKDVVIDPEEIGRTIKQITQ